MKIIEFDDKGHRVEVDSRAASSKAVGTRFF